MMWWMSKTLVRKGEQIQLFQGKWGSVQVGRVRPSHWACVVLHASASGERRSQWGALLRGVEYLVCRQVEVKMSWQAGQTWSVVGSPALMSHPDSAAEPASLPCATLLAYSGTIPADPHRSRKQLTLTAWIFSRQ